MTGKTPKKGRIKVWHKGQPGGTGSPLWVKLATDLYNTRKKLRRLIDNAGLDDAQSKESSASRVMLRDEILSLKAQLKELGKDPDVAVGALIRKWKKQARSKVQSKKKPAGAKYRAGGVGAYPLGGTIKNWR